METDHRKGDRKSMKYVWTSNLETGHKIVDEQHKALVGTFNELLDASAKGEGCKELEHTIDFLMDYTKKHFVAEEDLQLKYQYPEYEHHRQLHQEFTKIMQELCGRLREEGPNMSLLGRVNREMGDWLILHIKIEDAKLVKFIKEKEAQSKKE